MRENQALNQRELIRLTRRVVVAELTIQSKQLSKYFIFDYGLLKEINLLILKNSYNSRKDSACVPGLIIAFIIT